jgi:hypothetical protein
MEANLFGAHFDGAYRAAITSCFINGKISEQLIDVMKEAFSKFREYEIEYASIMPEKKDELKRQLKQLLEATTQGIKDELRAEGKLW